jgi:protein TonB
LSFLSRLEFLLHRGRPDLAMRFDPAAEADRGHSHGAHDTDLVVLTDAEDFHSAVKAAVNAQQRVWRVPTAEQAAELLIAGRVGVLIVDSDSLPHGAPTLIMRLNLEFPDLVVVVAGTHDEAPQFARLVSEGMVYRFLQKPVSAARVRAFIDAALRRHSELMANAPAVVHARGSGRASRKLWLAVLAIALCGIGFMLTRRHQSTSPEPPAATQHIAQAQAVPERVVAPNTVAEVQTARIGGNRKPPAEADAADLARRAQVARDQAAIDHAAGTHGPAPATPSVTAEPDRSAVAAESSGRQIKRFLRDADAAIAADNLIGADGGSAQSLVTAALAVDPENAAAQQMKKRLQDAVVSRAQSAIAKADSAAAGNWIASAQQLGVADTDVTALRRAQADREQHARGERLAGLARLAAQRLADDKLTEPAEDNALQYLKQLQIEDPTLAAPLMQQLAERLLTKARREIAQGGYDSADQWLKEAQETGVSTGEVAAVRSEAQNARARAAFLANVLPSSKLMNTKYVAPAYPSKALRQNVEGWVDLEFTLDMRGGVQDVTVKNAVPTGVFEKAAVDAVSQWRYQPVTRNGAAIEQRSAIRVQFKLEK